MALSVRSSVFCNSSFFTTVILPLPSFIHVTDHFLCNPRLSCFPVDLPTKSFAVHSTYFSILFRCTYTFPLSHSTAPSFSSRLSYTFCHSAYKFSKYHLGFTFWNRQSAPSSVCTSFILFHKYTVQMMSISISWCLPGVQSSTIFLKPCAGDNSAHTDGGT